MQTKTPVHLDHAMRRGSHLFAFVWSLMRGCRYERTSWLAAGSAPACPPSSCTVAQLVTSLLQCGTLARLLGCVFKSPSVDVMVS
jgi:hypothetical protein